MGESAYSALTSHPALIDHDHPRCCNSGARFLKFQIRICVADATRGPTERAREGEREEYNVFSQLSLN